MTNSKYNQKKIIHGYSDIHQHISNGQLTSQLIPLAKSDDKIITKEFVGASHQ